VADLAEIQTPVAPTTVIAFFPGAPDTSGWDPHSGIVRSARVWVEIDLLFDGEDDHQGGRPDPATARGLRPTGQLARMACAQTCR